MYYPEDSVFVTGAAKVSKDDVINAAYQSFALCLIVDTHTNRILSLSCTMVLPETVDFVRSLLVGHDLLNDMPQMIDTIHRRFLAMSQKALIAALYDAQNRYLMAFPDAKARYAEP